MALTIIEATNGFMSLVFVIISIIIGLKITLKYFKHRQLILLLAGISWIGISEAWWPSSVNFILSSITGQTLSLGIYMILGYSLIPIFMFVWLIAVTELLYKKKQKVVLLIFAIEFILFEVFFLYYALYNPNSIGELQTPVNIKLKSFLLYYMIAHIILFLITGFLLSYESLKSENPEIKLKGKFLLTAFISFGIGATLDVIFPIGFILNRLILISSAFEFYCGFILPKRVKRIFLKES